MIITQESYEASLRKYGDIHEGFKSTDNITKTSITFEQIKKDDLGHGPRLKAYESEPGNFCIVALNTRSNSINDDGCKTSGPEHQRKIELRAAKNIIAGVCAAFSDEITIDDIYNKSDKEIKPYFKKYAKFTKAKQKEYLQKAVEEGIISESFFEENVEVIND